MAKKDDDDDDERKKSKESSTLAEAFKMVTRQLIVVIGPLAVVGAVLGNVASGFGLLISSVKVLATALAPILLPVLVVLSAAIVAASEVIFRNLLPSLGEWYKFVLSTLIPATLELADAFLSAADFLLRNSVDVAEDISDFWSDLQDDLAVNMGSVAEGLGLVDEGTTAVLEEDRAKNREEREAAPPRFQETRDAIEAIRARLGAFRSEEAGGQGQFGQAFTRAMDDVLQSFQLQVGPKAQTTGIAEAVKQAQMAALNVDPLEARQLAMLTQILQTIRQAWEETKGAKPGAQVSVYGAASTAMAAGIDVGRIVGGGFAGDF